MDPYEKLRYLTSLAIAQRYGQSREHCKTRAMLIVQQLLTCVMIINFQWRFLLSTIIDPVENRFCLVYMSGIRWLTVC